MAVALVAVVPTEAQPQSVLIRQNEPQELSGDPKPYPAVSDGMKQLVKAFEGDWNSPDQLSAKRALLDLTTERFPQLADAYFMRATIVRCLQKSTEAGVLPDVDKAIELASATKPEIELTSVSSMHAFKAKVESDRGNHKTALDELEKAITLAPEKAVDLFNTGGVDPETEADPCRWSKGDLDGFVTRYPTDYRSFLNRGLYYTFFARLKPEYSAQAIADITKATVLNPRSGLAFYLLAEIHDARRGLLSLLTEGQKATSRQQALAAYTSAVGLDPTLAPAFASRANIYFNLKQYAQAIRDFDSALALTPDRGSWLNDRGLAKLNTNNLYGAIDDFTKAIKAKGPFGDMAGSSYENLADAHAKVGSFDRAVEDMTQAIKLQLANAVFLMNIGQVRKVYPEFRGLSDDALCRRLHQMFFSNMDYAVFAKQLLDENAKRGGWNLSTVMPEQYVKRGDYYIGAGNYRAALTEYRRALDGFPESAQWTERWRFLFKSATDELYVDGRTAEFSETGMATFWLKLVNTSTNAKGTSTVQNYSINCRSKTLNVLSVTRYDTSGTVTASSQYESGPQTIIPDTIGERLYLGMCR
jgi:tetratricopeptide (TPR) repeat protein